MRRKRRDEDEAPVVPSSPLTNGVRPIAAPSRVVVPTEAGPSVPSVPSGPVAAPVAAEPDPEPEPRAPELTDPIGLDDLERGRTVALLAALGRVQLTLDLLERRVGRIEDRLDRVEAATGPLPAAPLDALREPAPVEVEPTVEPEVERTVETEVEPETAIVPEPDLPADLGDGGVEAAYEEAEFGEEPEVEEPEAAEEFENDADAELPTTPEHEHADKD